MKKILYDQLLFFCNVGEWLFTTIELCQLNNNCGCLSLFEAVNPGGISSMSCKRGDGQVRDKVN
jgi:hypothetical protein